MVWWMRFALQVYRFLAQPKAQRNWKAPKSSLKISSLAITFQPRLTPTSLKLSQLWLMCVKKVRRL
ncbi:Uncharacterised protein [Vibrio cholerae]|nr:Uncharacterised protein [Vibrio cholerae]